MGSLHSLAKIRGLKHLLTPFVTAVIGDGVLMQLLVVHGQQSAKSVMAQGSPGYKNFRLDGIKLHIAVSWHSTSLTGERSVVLISETTS